MIYRVSPSDIEAFLFYKRGMLSLEEYIESIKTWEGFSRKAFLGTCLHDLLEYAGDGDTIESYIANGEEVRITCDIELPKPVLTEVKVETIAAVGNYEVIIAGKIDRIDGGMISDYKLAFRLYDFDKYNDSLQWKMYLYMLGMDEFRYLVFSAKELKRDGFVNVYRFDSISLFRYQRLDSDVVDIVEEYLSFLERNGLGYYRSMDRYTAYIANQKNNRR